MHIMSHIYQQFTDICSTMFLLQAQDEKNKAAAERGSNTEAIQKVKEDLEEQMSTLRKQHDEKVTNLEDRLQVALGKTLKILRSRARVNYNIKTMITTQELKSNIFL